MNNKKTFYFKLVFISLISFILFYWINKLLFTPIVNSFRITGSDSVAVSYLVPIYAATSGLASSIIVCTYLILNKINELIKISDKGDSYGKTGS